MFAETRTRAVLACITIAAGLTGALSLHSTELAAQSSPTVTVTPTTVAPGATVTVTIANGPANATDWVGLFTTAAADTLMLDWKRSEEHTSELQSRLHLVCRLLL